MTPMQYRKSLEIEARLDAVLKLIRRGRFSTRGLAEKVGVSIPTISRSVQALRQRGHKIRSESGEGGWRFVLVQQPKASEVKKD
jgi:predicted DNA-binding transcriptional regulator YafY